MQFGSPLAEGRLIRRYKRFLADVAMQDGTHVTAHCANTGSMSGCAQEGARVWLSPSPNPAAKLPWRWELVETGRSLTGINTSRANAIVAEAILAGKVPELSGYARLKREIRYGGESRIDILLEEPGQCYVEVKSVTLAEGDTALFPDAVTARGAKHLKALTAEAAAGRRAVMFYLVQRMDCARFAPAGTIDPVYAQTLRAAVAAGVEILAYQCRLSLEEIVIDRPLPLSL